MCDYCGLDNLYPYDNPDEILEAFEAEVDEQSSVKISMVCREKKLNDRIRELEKQIADMQEQDYKRGVGQGVLLVTYRNKIRELEAELEKYKNK